MEMGILQSLAGSGFAAASFVAAKTDFSVSLSGSQHASTAVYLMLQASDSTNAARRSCYAVFPGAAKRPRTLVQSVTGKCCSRLIFAR